MAWKRLVKVGRSTFSSFSQDWRTPRAIYQTLDAEFGFTLDPCPLGSETDGLSTDWSGQVVFVNPPYNDVSPWIKKAFETEGATTVCLVASRTDTAWWHDYAMKASEIRFIRGRIRFEQHGKRANGSGTAPFPSAIVVFRRHYKDFSLGEQTCTSSK